MLMRGRDFDSMLTVYRPVESRGEYGEIAEVFEVVGNIRADRVKNDGRRLTAVGEEFSLYTAEYHIRDGNTVEEHWRVRDMDSGTLYEVAAKIHDRRKRMTTIKCVGVNPNGEESN